MLYINQYFLLSISFDCEDETVHLSHMFVAVLKIQFWKKDIAFLKTWFSANQSQVSDT